MSLNSPQRDRLWLEELCDPAETQPKTKTENQHNFALEQIQGKRDEFLALQWALIFWLCSLQYCWLNRASRIVLEVCSALERSLYADLVNTT
jgi:hypothetical protein